MENNFAVWGPSYTSKAMYIAERSLVLTPVTGLVNIVKAAFTAIEAACAEAGDNKDALKARAWAELKHGAKTFLPVLGFVFVVIPRIFKDTKAYFEKKNADASQDAGAPTATEVGEKIPAPQEKSIGNRLMNWLKSDEHFWKPKKDDSAAQ